ncbi:hypothetical protein [Ornithinimicrobium kibberense]|uniref:hypothetical protein n=1 Tax=Ornithinimicrobium kibberense TaxID=282060 RepID=UPI0036084A12
MPSSSPPFPRTDHHLDGRPTAPRRTFRRCTHVRTPVRHTRVCDPSSSTSGDEEERTPRMWTASDALPGVAAGRARPDGRNGWVSQAPGWSVPTGRAPHPCSFRKRGGALRPAAGTPPRAPTPAGRGPRPAAAWCGSG